MTEPPNENAPTEQGQGVTALHNKFRLNDGTADPLLQRLECVQKSRSGWRSRCPACGGMARKVSITQVHDRVLVYCFGGCQAIEVLQAVGLGWPDIMPPRHWPQSPEERRKAHHAIREVGWASALKVLALESEVALIAARQLARWEYLSEEDDNRLAEAVERIYNASNVLCEAAAWRPAVKP